MSSTNRCCAFNHADVGARQPTMVEFSTESGYNTLWRQQPAVTDLRGVDAPKTGCSVDWMSVDWMSVGWIAHPLHEGGLLLGRGQAAVLHDDDAIGHIEDLVVVGDHDDRGVLLAGQLLHQLHHGAA